MTARCEPGLPACGCGPIEPFDWAAWWRVGVGILIAANSMTLSLAVNTSETTPGEARALHLALMALTGASLAILGWPLARNAGRALLERRITIEAMFLAGLIGASAASGVAIVTGAGDVYFEIVTILLVVYGFGQQLTSQVQDRALRSAVAWSPEIGRCLVVDGTGRSREVAVADLAPGDLVLVPPGQMIAADGVVAAGRALVREAEITGEPFAVEKRPDDRVWAGTVCVDASLTVRATTDGGHRRIDRILEAVERARRAPSTLQEEADRLVAWFLPAVVSVAALTFAVWLGLAGWERALFNAMAVLLVACPCALGLATPLVLWGTVARLAAGGVVVHSGDMVEALGQVDAVVFDKTGTITESEAALIDLVVVPPAELDRAAVMDMVGVVERVSCHPVAAAFGALGEGPEGGRWAVELLAPLPGVGIEATVVEAASGRRRRLAIGDAERLVEPGDPRWRELAAALRGGIGARRIAVLVDGQAAGAALVDERLRASWRPALARLRSLGLEVVVMTGDRAERARVTAADRVLAELTPEGKLDEVRRLQEVGRTVLFVGDGINDAAAMAAADASIAVAAGSDLAIEVGSAAWHGQDLRAIPRAIEVTRRATNTIRGNLRLAVAYNLVGISLAALGVLHPVVATVLMTCSSVVVTWRAMGGVSEQEAAEAAARAADPAGLGEEVVAT